MITGAASADKATGDDPEIDISIDRREFKKVLSRQVSIPLGFGVVTGLFFIAIIYYLLALGRWVETTDRVINDGNLLLQLVLDHETSVRGFFITGKEEFLEPYYSAKRRIQPVVAQMNDLVAEDPVQAARVNDTYQIYLQWIEYTEDVIAIKRAGQATEGIAKAARGKPMVDEMRLRLSEFLAAEETTKIARQRRSESIVVALSGGYFVISLLFSGLMAYGGRNQLQKLSSTYSNLLRQQRQQTKTLEQKRWLRAGESRFADKVIGSATATELGHGALEFFAEYMQVRIGALYVRDADNRFVRQACYGFSVDRQTQGQSFAVGEGLTGQAVAEQRTLYIDTIDTAYFRVNSMLGEVKPALVAIVPIITEGVTIGALELGFLRVIKQLDRDLLDLIGGRLAIALVATNYRAQLVSTLDSVQQLNDELQAQQEELRVINEELEEQSKVLEESQFQLEAQQAELEQTNQALEQQSEVLHNRNETLQQTQQLLEEHAHQLERASQYKSEFLANMSHELRTPLNSQLILSQILAENTEGNLTPEQVRSARTINSAGNDLLALINDVLDISRVEAGKLEVRPDHVVLAQVLDTLTANFTNHAREKSLTFTVAADTDVSIALYTDRHRLEQILRNLLANAIKFTESGEVRLRVSATAAGRMLFVVSDTGIGIANAQIEKIFEPFHQADSGISRKYGGTGLGLSISRQLSGLLGGHIDATSEPGVGSVFTLDIPVTLAMASTLQESRPTPPLPSPRESRNRRSEPPFADDRERLSDSKKTILVIEDEIEFARVLYNVARELDYQCLVATSAEDGLALAEQYVLHAVLLDMKLPDHSGMTILAHLKAQPRTRHIPVHIISVEDRTETALHLGAVGYLLKPATHEQLREVFATIERRVARKTRSVLVVETPGEPSAATAALIADTDVEVETVTTAADALAQLRARAFDCLIADFALADMDAADMLEKMSHEELAFPPVIVYSARNLEREEEARLLRYSRSIVVKATRSPERLLEEVTLFLHKVESDLSQERRSLLRSSRTRARELEGRRILLVDDDVRNIFALTSALERRGASVEIGRNGLDALKKLEEVPDIDLVLMDMMMPEMDGYEATAAIRKQERFAKLPVIAVTARAMRDDQERCLRAGANDYVAKPVDVDRLISLIQVWLPKVQRV
jgi:signal transduction histidine kinase/DNA-binding response OmpR family regulator/CHASE3 domain sensor protein